MAVYVNQTEDWLRWIAPEEFEDRELFRIVVFFVFHSPCSGLSSMGRSLASYGWNAPWRKPYKLNCQLKQASTNYSLVFSAESYDQLEDALEKANLGDDFTDDLITERIAIYDKNKNQFMSIFYHIRNSLAHGRMNMIDNNGDCIFIMEDVVPNRNSDRLKLSARMVLRKETLLNWIHIIEGGEVEFHREDEPA